MLSPRVARKDAPPASARSMPLQRICQRGRHIWSGLDACPLGGRPKEVWGSFRIGRISSVETRFFPNRPRHRRRRCTEGVLLSRRPGNCRSFRSRRCRDLRISPPHTFRGVDISAVGDMIPGPGSCRERRTASHRTDPGVGGHSLAPADCAATGASDRARGRMRGRRR